MKKFLLTLGVLLMASMSNAAYLYWQLDNSSAADTTGVTVYSTGDSGTSTVQVWGLGQDSDGNPILVPVASDNMYTDLVYAIDENSIQDGYSYYIEITHSDSSTTTSKEISASDFRTYTAESATTSLTDIDNGDATVPIWHASAGGGMSPVPEPTSAILMMFGMAFLGLKRKNRSIA